MFPDEQIAPNPIATALGYEQAKLHQLVTLCRELQRVRGDSSFSLSCRVAGRILGVDHDVAWRWLFLLVADRVLRVDIAGAFDAGNHQATTYYYEAKDL